MDNQDEVVSSAHIQEGCVRAASAALEAAFQGKEELGNGSGPVAESSSCGSGRNQPFPGRITHDQSQLPKPGACIGRSGANQ